VSIPDVCRMSFPPLGFDGSYDVLRWNRAESQRLDHTVDRRWAAYMASSSLEGASSHALQRQPRDPVGYSQGGYHFGSRVDSTLPLSILVGPNALHPRAEDV
jgi:hypothetical protein